jgi:hypothetical protein
VALARLTWRRTLTRERSSCLYSLTYLLAPPRGAVCAIIGRPCDYRCRLFVLFECS